MAVEEQNRTLELLNNAKFLKEIRHVDGYLKYMDASFYSNNGLSQVLNQIVYANDLRIMRFIHLSENVKEVLGLEYDYVFDNGPMSLSKHILDEDNKVLNVEILPSIAEVAIREQDNAPENLRFTFNFRIKTSSGEVRCILNKFTIIILGEHGVPLVSVGTMTDITQVHHKKELFCEGARIHDDGSTEVILRKVFPEVKTKNQYNLTKKELEVLKLAMEGHLSKEIAEATNRSIETIHSHRKNIIKKMKCNSITDAIVIAKDENWF